ncbi:SDR family NAD(P)-dependent oxidoreductase [Roseibium porphyridii]|uniref:SDR family NAD(P)-dependent oxidoreductase n=1 Tax=Roseibium porphyridii TaxID=2866279 RepID=A0ABY8F2T3_9HYPH|nr:SDR family oxidoreductase [Roseibium sp. KMA01]WFE89797.1 SDR family NAD(P)-dependent oxidoreductase [Roseibium sp. KMA01]
MILKGKTAVVFGAGGHLGQHIADRFEAEGASVFRASNGPVDGSTPKSAQVDATDEVAVDAYLDQVAEEQGSIDVVVNMAGVAPASYNHGKPAAEVTHEQFMMPLAVDTASQFITAKSAYRHMSEKGSGVIILNTSTLAKVGSPWSPALTASHAATEGLMRSLAHEYGPAGVRVLGVRSEAMPDSPTIEYTFATMGANMGMGFDEMKGFIEQNKTALKKLPEASDTAAVFAYAASDMASFLAGTMINNSAGHIVD